jgi:hypothetical protein
MQTESSPPAAGAKKRAERLAIIGDGDLAGVIDKRARAAGWAVERVSLFAADNGGEKPGLGDAPSQDAETATIVIVATAAAAHPTLSVLLADSVAPDALVVLVPGQTGGAFQIARALERRGRAAVVAETSWSPVVSVAGNRTTIDVPSVPLGTAAPDDAPAAVRRLEPLFKAEPAPSALWTSLHAPDLVLRTVPGVVAAAESGGKKITWGQALTGAAEGICWTLDEERRAVAKAMGMQMPTLVEWLSTTFETPRTSLVAAMGPLADLKVPAYTNEMWLADLVPYGLAPLCALGAKVGTELPCARSIMTLAGAMLGNDYELGGRSLEDTKLVGVPA